MNCYLLRQSRTKMKKCCWKDSFLNYDFPPLKLFFFLKKGEQTRRRSFLFRPGRKESFCCFYYFHSQWSWINNDLEFTGEKFGLAKFFLRSLRHIVTGKLPINAFKGRQLRKGRVDAEKNIMVIKINTKIVYFELLVVWPKETKCATCLLINFPCKPSNGGDYSWM